jgi:hypothetical protein
LFVYISAALSITCSPQPRLRNRTTNPYDELGTRQSQYLGVSRFHWSTSSYTDSCSPADQIITLKVGGNQPQLLYIHQGVLCRSSAFFKRATKPEWADQRDDPHVIDLSEDITQLVKDYINWCYSGVLPINMYNKSVDRDDKLERSVSAKEVEKVYVALAIAYAFGEKIIDNMYKNAVLDRIIATHKASNWTPGSECARIIYGSTTTASPARRLLCDLFAHGACDDSSLGVGWMSMIPDHPKEFMVDAIQSLLKLRPKNCDQWSTPPESYHEDEA